MKKSYRSVIDMVNMTRQDYRVSIYPVYYVRKLKNVKNIQLNTRNFISYKY